MPEAAALDVGLAASCDAMVFRALERAEKNLDSENPGFLDFIYHLMVFLHDLDARLERLEGKEGT